MLPKKFRLKKRSAFTATYKSGTSFHKNGITVFCGKKKTSEFVTKIGFVVSKKYHKRAVKRNRIKRLMREAMRLYIKNSETEFDTSYISLIFIPSAKMLDKGFDEVNYAVNKLMEVIKHD